MHDYRAVRNKIIRIILLCCTVLFSCGCPGLIGQGPVNNKRGVFFEGRITNSMSVI